MARTGGKPQTVSKQAAREFATFYRDNRLRVTHFLMKLGATRDEAEDTTQQAMQDLLRRWTLIQQPRAWIYVAAERQLRRNLKRQSREPVYEAIEQACESGTARSAWHGGPMHHQDLEGFGDEARRVIELLRQLPPEQRRVMAYTLDGFGASEIAERIGKPVETVRSNLRHARARLTRALQADQAAAPVQAGGTYATAGQAV